MPAKSLAFENPDDALRAISDRLKSVDRRTTAKLDDCSGRVLAAEVIADRASPAADISAMDGYAIRLADLKPGCELPVSGESAPGAAPPPMAAGAAVRIFTGAIVPDGCEAIVKREDTEELGKAIRFRESALGATAGEHIRRAGENAQSGSTVLEPGIQLTAAQVATMANFGCTATDVFSPVRVSIITTGDEVRQVDADDLQPWQLRNSNRAALMGLLSAHRWLECTAAEHCRDDRQSLTAALQAALSQSDAVLLTGGVSMGDYDYVPDVVRDCGGNVVFHGLPIRPGKPILGAATDAGKLILGLPGNPVSATVGGRRMAVPLLAKLSGQRDWTRPGARVRLDGGDDKTIPLHWMRLVRLSKSGTAELVPSRGSGDLVSLGYSTGFVELPPDENGSGPWPYYAW